MDLWIRTQNNLSLIKVNYVYISQSSSGINIMGETTSSFIKLGKYKSMKKALIILNKINDLLEDTYIGNRVVYRMPIEEGE